eukprot:gene32255-39826_t
MPPLMRYARKARTLHGGPQNLPIQNITRYTHPSVWSRLSPSLYILFWSLSVYDIATPTSRYQLELKRIKDRYADLENKRYIVGNNNTVTGLPYTPSEVSKLNKQRESELSKMMLSMAALNEEMSQQNAHVAQIKLIIDNQKESYFIGTTPECSEEVSVVVEVQVQGEESKVEEVENGAMEVTTTTVSVTETSIDTTSDETKNILAITDMITQHLVYHRVLMSPSDAVFCTQFLLVLHEQETPFFSLLHCYDRFVKTITPLIFCTTEVEASFIGYAINDMFATINRWVGDKKAYKREVQDKKGASYSIDSLLPKDVLEGIRSKQQAAAASSADGSVADESTVTHEMFCELTKVWHSRLTSTLLSSLAGKEYMYVRCALLVLSKVNAQFPTRAVEGRKLLQRVELLQIEEKNREDLQTMAKSLSTMLKRTAWIDEKAVKTNKKTAKLEEVVDGVGAKPNAATAVPIRRDGVKEEPRGAAGRDAPRDGRDGGRNDPRDNGRDANTRDNNATNSRAGPPYSASSAVNTRDNGRGGVTRANTNPPASGADGGSWRDNKVPQDRDAGPNSQQQRGAGEANRREDSKAMSEKERERDRRASNNTVAPSVTAPPSDYNSRDARRNERDRDNASGNNIRGDNKPAAIAPSVVAPLTGSKRKTETAIAPSPTEPASASKSQKVDNASVSTQQSRDDRRGRSNSRDRKNDSNNNNSRDNKDNNRQQDASKQQKESVQQDAKESKNNKRSREESNKDNKDTDSKKSEKGEKDEKSSEKSDKSDKTADKSDKAADKAERKDEKKREKEAKESKERESKESKDKEKEREKDRSSKDKESKDSKDSKHEKDKEKEKEKDSKQQTQSNSVSRQDSRTNLNNQDSNSNPNSKDRADSRDRGSNNTRGDSRDRKGSDYRGATNQFDWNNPNAKSSETGSVTTSVNSLKTDKRQDRKGQNQQNGPNTDRNGGDRNGGADRDSRNGKSGGGRDKDTKSDDKPVADNKKEQSSKDQDTVPVAVVSTPAVIAAESTPVAQTASVSESGESNDTKAAARATRFAKPADSKDTTVDLVALKARLLAHKQAEKPPADSDSVRSDNRDDRDGRDNRNNRERERDSRDIAPKEIIHKPRNNGGGAMAKYGPQDGAGEVNASNASAPVVTAPVVAIAPGLEHVELSDIIKEQPRGSKRPRPDSAASNKASDASSVTPDNGSVASPPAESPGGKRRTP